MIVMGIAESTDIPGAAPSSRPLAINRRSPDDAPILAPIAAPIIVLTIALIIAVSLWIGTVSMTGSVWIGNSRPCIARRGKLKRALIAFPALDSFSNLPINVMWLRSPGVDTKAVTVAPEPADDGIPLVITACNAVPAGTKMRGAAVGANSALSVAARKR